MTAYNLQAALDEIGMNQTDLVRFMRKHGDDRPHETIRRTVGNWCRGATRVPGEMRVLVRILQERQGAAHQ